MTQNGDYDTYSHFPNLVQFVREELNISVSRKMKETVQSGVFHTERQLSDRL